MRLPISVFQALARLGEANLSTLVMSFSARLKRRAAGHFMTCASIVADAVCME